MEIYSRPPTQKGTAATFTHWHSHRHGRFMAHLALMEGDGSDEPQTTWGEAVTDSDYRAPRTPAR
jgi:hypothetical protein